jgi:hypothetical protein
MPLLMLWGTRTRETGYRSGTFTCPVCNTEQYYQHVNATRWYCGLIIVVPYWFTRDLGPHYQFARCKHLFPEELLTPILPPFRLAEQEEIPPEDLLQQIREELEMGTSVEQTKRLLLEAGTNGEIAIKLVNTVVAGRVKRCAQCGQGYLDTLASCPRCGRTL